jgi:dienelactone hydrolase
MVILDIEDTTTFFNNLQWHIHAEQGFFNNQFYFYLWYETDYPFLPATYFCFGLFAQSGLSLPGTLIGKIPWHLDELALPPSFDWENREDSVWSLKYKGEKYKGETTDVFAYYASPSTISGAHSAGEKFPAVVLIHGGGGTAFRIWALEWAKKGYAAIVMDLGGSMPAPSEEQDNPWGSKSTRLVSGGPPQGDEHKFFLLDQEFSEQWQFHAVSNIIRAHSLVRSLKEVDKERTAMTGISWGGYLTNIVAGIDHRFKVAVPVYGCGFLHEGSAWDQQFDSLGTERTRKWVNLWDPSQYVVNAKMPILFINGTNDFAYFVENWYKTAQLVPNHRLALIPQMKHSHPHGAEPGEIFNFIQYHLGQGEGFASFENANMEGEMLKANINHESNGRNEIYLVYTRDNARSPNRDWKMMEIELMENNIEKLVPKEALLWYLYLIDERGNRISSALFNK